MIHCRVLGPIEVRVDDGPAPPELLWRKNLALLVYLARSPKRSRSREHLIGLLWPDKPEAAARHSLNEALRPIRHCLGEGRIITEADRIQLAPDAVRLDTDDFDRLAQSEDWCGAAALVSGMFLEGLAVPGASGFEEWLTAEQRGWNQRSIEVLLRTAEGEVGMGRVREAIAFANRARAIDPLSESAVRTLVRSQALDGDRSGALRTYEEFRTRLDAELKTRPSAETTALMERVRRERERRVPLREGAGETLERRRAPLVGREQELANLLAVWRSGPATGTAAAIVVAGDAGVGKTRLVDELVARIRLDGAVSALVRAVDGDRLTPWSGLVGLARGGLLEASGLAAAPPAALAWFAERLPDWADRFPAARRATPSASPAAAFGDLLNGALGEQPVALIVDDAERLDAESLHTLVGALRDLARRPLLLVFTVPAAPARVELDELQTRIGRDIAGRVERLAALSAAGLRELAHWAVPAYDEPALDRLTRRVFADSAGLPILAIEILNAVALGLDLATLRGTWPAPLRTLDQTLPGGLPEAIVGAIRVGFRRLSPDAQRTLQVAAVLPSPLVLDQLTRASGLAPDVATAALDELEWGRWLVADGRGYAFAARIVGEVIASDQLTAGQRQRIVAAAGEAS